jgi:DNA-binding transcriptional MerR regulator
MDPAPRRRLTIGEYAVATQLTAKALRLYDEQGLLKPTLVDPASGYRYYQADQVATGRLVRTMRDMNLSLAQVRHLLDTPSGSQPAVLRDFLYDAERRHARERTAYQSALLMLRSATPGSTVHIAESAASAELVAVFGFVTNRSSFIEHALQQRSLRLDELQFAGVPARSHSSFVLAEPLTEDDTRIELWIPVERQTNLANLTMRHLPPHRYASVEAEQSAFLDGFTSSTDALFDWFDKRGVHAIGHPEVLLHTIDDALHANVRWAFSTNQDT